jgi:hypothetical protein
MAKISAKGAVIYVDDSAGAPQAISGDVRSYELEQDAGKIEVTGFTNTSQNFIPGLPVYGIALDVMFNSAATTGAWTVLKGIFNSTASKTVMVVPEAGSVFTGEFMLDALPVKGAPDGVLEIGSIHFSTWGSTGSAWSTST